MYIHHNIKWLKHWDFMLMDFVLLQVAFLLSFSLRHGFDLLYMQPVYKAVALIIALSTLCVGILNESYKGVLRRGYWREFLAAIKHVSIVTAIVIICLFLAQVGQYFSRIVILLFPLASVAFVYPGRIGLKLYLRQHRGTASGKRSIVLVTAENNYRDMIDVFLNNPYSEFTVAGALVLGDEHREYTVYRDVPVYEDKERVLNMMTTGWVDEVMISFPKNKPVDEDFVNKCKLMGLTIHEKLARVNAEGKQIVEKLEGYTVLTTTIATATPAAAMGKRLLDICGGLVGCMITLLLILTVGPMIYIKDPGPIFFSQKRLGKNGKPFTIYKFRSMYRNAEERKKELLSQNNVNSGLMFKMDNDPRIIKGIGQFIRDFSIDEFPQFWNVLKGDMSLVGTRPPLPGEVEQYQYHHRSRLATKPGITGMWQISGRSDITDFEEVVRLDKEYIENWTLGLDIKLILQTVLVVLQRKGSK